jgi:2-succinyl-5-enolpyruvyl-6-hydroxy-3-cyclohexene-1-carboxylate synthase
MFDLPYQQPTSIEAFRAAYARAITQDRSCIIEVRTDRAENVRFHQRIESAVRRASV